MKFDINNYKGKYVMHCKTEEEAREFCNYLHSIGECWCTEKSYSESTLYDKYEAETVYEFNTGHYADVSYYKGRHFTILEFSDFDWSTEFTKADLKTGDVILRRNGSVEIVNRELEMFIRKKYYGDLDKIKDDLTSTYSTRELDIIAVRRPVDKADCCFDAFKNNWGTLVYERKEPEEMTLAEVCKLLGKEIKIIP
jgi:hypothetical protein